ncbi:hypothetical protein [Actinopolymorpha alba]|uniref:hypothetical protein n=1 Tax=Actinopolymorpha alba TaxID=533267 RepID=UPI00036F7139|nr:hypothetical protein [Actinopolymorpha alba]
MVQLPPLLLTGGPAAGKTVTAQALARTTPRCAYIDVDDVRQLVKNGGAAPWEGKEGRNQHLLGVRNAAALSANFTRNMFNVTISDVIDAELLTSYRDLIPGVRIIRLSIGLEAARDRARSRPVYLTDEEFESLHRQQCTPLDVDLDIDVTGMAFQEQVETIRQSWSGSLSRSETSVSETAWS